MTIMPLDIKERTALETLPHLKYNPIVFVCDSNMADKCILVFKIQVHSFFIFLLLCLQCNIQ
ncbi:hypothetical protein B1207_04600 [Legionella quinlivanii]|uniref:Uncharacterized protein n=1 Tax=Legionella quinlivanii TaxID=45073 RepID=A0A364LL48_9GAMM|nr:hypothetical protein B1207_04600 [Legionella quinlivanii]